MATLEINDDLARKLDSLARQSQRSIEELLAAHLPPAAADSPEGSAVESERGFQDCLKILHEASLELAHIASLDEMVRRAVEIGLHQLGFDRIGFFVMDFETGMTVGTWGTDAQGNLRNEGQVRIDPGFARENWYNPIMGNQERTALWEDIDLCDLDGSVIGHGWNLLAALWDGDRVIGYCATDNVLSGRAMRQFERELLSLYGRTIGYLVSRHRTHDALSSSESRFRTLLEAAPVAIFVIAANGEINTVNQEAEHIFGYARHELIHLPFEKLIPGFPGSIPEYLRATSATESQAIHTSPEHPLNGLHKNGTTLPIEMVLKSIRLDGTALTLCFVTDISLRLEVEKRQRELALERERSMILSKFIRDASHEFKTPLSIIKMKLFILRRSLEIPEDDDNFILIEEQADNILHLVDDLATIVRLDTGAELELSAVSLNEICQNLVTKYHEEIEKRGMKILLQPAAGLPRVSGDLDELTGALLRIFANALRYTADGGSISIRSYTQDADVLVEFTDTGCGIHENDLPFIFDRFFRADEAHSTRGFGLGLSIARRILEYHGGSIEVKSIEGRGSTFTVRLPAKTAS